MTGEHRNRPHAGAATRSVATAERARSALLDMHKHSDTITFASVAARADVSRQFLYTHPELRAEIERLRSRPRPTPARPPRDRASDESIRTRLRAALDENKRLRAELTDLRDEVALLHGHLRELELAKGATAPSLIERA
ncbi:MAG: DUF6262 family protein [Actinobacteria bacterium]|nr:DUF6262 family protein [Actinomycetota bacterium]MCA1697845.1 DUF6262 family protein [Actinomycetota bacterium]